MRPRAPKLAVDLPSGLDCETGTPAAHTVRAAETCTFVAAKTGFLAPQAAPYLGRLHVLDIGVPRNLIERSEEGRVWNWRSRKITAETRRRGESSFSLRLCVSASLR